MPLSDPAPCATFFFSLPSFLHLNPPFATNLSTIPHQTASSSPALARIEAQLASITNQLESLAQQQAALAQQLPQAKLLELLASLVNLNDLPKLLKQLNSNLLRIAAPTQPAAPQKSRAPKTSKTHTDEKSLSVKFHKGLTKSEKPGSNVQSPTMKKTPPAQAAQAHQHKHAPAPPAHAEDSRHTTAETLSVSQAASLLNKDVATIRRWCESGKIKAEKINGQWKIDQQALKKKSRH